MKKSVEKKRATRELERKVADQGKELYAANAEIERLEKDCVLMQDHMRMQEAFHAGEAERGCRERARAAARLRRERLESAKWRRTAIAGAVLMAIAVAIMALATFATPVSAEERMDPTSSVTADAVTPSPSGEGLQETDENALIEAALFENGYFRDDVPLDGDTQAELHAACDEFGIQYELALAVIHQETGYRNVTGDNGKSIGYMQVQPRWCQARMAELGIRDLSIPYDNFRTGCSILAEAIDHYGLVGGLTAYNTGSPGTSAYASEVLAYMTKLEG